MTVTAQLVKELRERTGAPMMECKKALTQTAGDIEKAIEEMRKSGLTKADKKSGRTAAEGLISIKISEDDLTAAILELNCETDFVARDENFTGFAKEIIETALSREITDVAALAELPYTKDNTQNFEEARKTLIAKIGENINIRRLSFYKVEAGLLGAYVHSGRIGVLVHLNGGDVELAKDIAMHIAASNPQVILPEDFPEDALAKEREIYVAKSQDSGKPAEIVEKIIQGQLKKFLDQVSLVGQSFVKDPDVTVGQLLKSKKAEVKRFVRYEVGEGIEKETTDFAKEVMAQVHGSA